jgi:hypothetical protein
MKCVVVFQGKTWEVEASPGDAFTFGSGAGPYWGPRALNNMSEADWAASDAHLIGGGDPWFHGYATAATATEKGGAD